ncbi:MAG: phosphonopyruvate decarboxylase [Stellaceae bacterium]
MMDGLAPRQLSSIAGLSRAGMEATMAGENPTRDWYRESYDALRHAGTELFRYVPDAGIDPFIRMAHADNSVRAVVMTTEEEGVGICCGAWLGGMRAVLMIQSSGVGNCVNAFTLARNARVPLLTLVSMRGEWGEGNRWQIPMGRATEEVMKLAGFTVYRATVPDEAVRLIEGAATMAYQSEQQVAVLLSQRLVGAKVFEDNE